MCGIAGFTYSNKSLIEKMTKALAWRGPDASGVYVSEGISLGHTRLSIIDLNSRSNQPMSSSCGKYHITYNGEIYNYNELKLKYLGNHVFKTLSETEVIVELFALLGPKCFSLLSGMFAIGIWDSVKSELYIARDRSGIKPLYYSLNNSVFYFASSPSVIANAIDRKILNLNALSTYARFGYSLGEESFFDGVNCFPSCKYAVYSAGQIKFFEYSQYRASSSGLSLYDLHYQEIKKHLISDCGVGVFLSGGIDSSIVAYHSAKLIDGLNTYTVHFSGEKINNKFNIDALKAREVSAFLKTNHHEVNLDVSEVPDFFNYSVEAMSSPISNPTSLALFKLSEYTSKSSKVILSGDGNDELFAGYDRYVSVKRRQFFLENFFTRGLVNFRHRNKSIDKFFDLFYRFHGNKDQDLYPCINFDWVDSEYIANTLNKFYSPPSRKINLQTLMRMERELWLQNFSFLLSDNMTMKQNVELRIPLMSDEIVYFSEHLLLNNKINTLSGKNNLRDIYKNHLPNFIFGSKTGFMSPASEWLRADKVKNALMDTLFTKNEIFDDLYDRESIVETYERHVSKERYNLNVLWSTFVLKKWMDFNNFTDVSS